MTEMVLISIVEIAKKKDIVKKYFVACKNLDKLWSNEVIKTTVL